MSNGFVRCLETKDFIPENCSFIKKCKTGFIRNSKGKCVKGDNLNVRLRTLRNKVNTMRAANNMKNRGLVKMQLINLMRDAGTPNREKIQSLINSAEKLTSKEQRLRQEKSTRKTVSEAKKLEKKKKENEIALKKAISKAKKKASEESGKNHQTLKQRKKANKTILGTALNVPMVPLSAIAESGVRGASRSGSPITPVLEAVESAVSSMSKSSNSSK